MCRLAYSRIQNKHINNIIVSLNVYFEATTSNSIDNSKLQDAYDVVIKTFQIKLLHSMLALDKKTEIHVFGIELISTKLWGLSTSDLWCLYMHIFIYEC